MSDVDISDAGRSIAAALGAIGGPAVLFRVLSLVVPNRRAAARAELRQDLAIYNELPEKGESRSMMREHIDQQVRVLAHDLATARRDPMRIGLGIFFLIAAAVCGYFAIANEGWLRWAVIVAALWFGLFGVVGISMGAPLVQRDEKGNAITSGNE